MEAYTSALESTCPVARESVRVVDALPNNITVRVMKPYGIVDEKYVRYNVWVEIDTCNHILWQKEFKIEEEANDLWQKISTELENGRYELVLHVDGSNPEISFPNLLT